MRTKATIRILSLLVICAISVEVQAQESKMERSVAPPAAASRAGPEVETTLFDIYLGDSFRGEILVNYVDGRDEQWLEIQSPEDFVEQIPDLITPAKLIPLLSGKIDKVREIPELGKIEYDVNTFRIMLACNPVIMQGSAVDLTAKIPTPDRKFSLQQELGLAAAGDPEETLQTAVNHKTLAALGEYYGRLNGSYVKDQEYELTDASVIGIVSDYQIATGMVQTPGELFSPSLQIGGVVIDTAEQILADSDLAKGSALEIFVPTRSRVEFYRAGRLLAVQELGFGLQEVNTSAFPQGSYDVEVLIVESNGNVIRERHFFTKSGFLASRGVPVFSLAAGVGRNQFTFSDSAIYRAGIRWRTLDFLEVDSSLYGQEEYAIGSLGTQALYHETRLGAVGSYSVEGDSAIAASVGSQTFGFNYDFSMVETLSVNDKRRPAQAVDQQEEQPDGNPDLIPDRLEQPRFVSFDDRSSRTASVSRSLGRLTLRYSLRTDQSPFQPQRHTRGPGAELTLYQGNQSSVRYLVNYFDTERGEIFRNGLEHRYQVSPSLSIGTLGSISSERDREELVGIVTLRYNIQNHANRGLDARISTEARRSRVGNQSTDSEVSRALVDYGSSYLQTTGFISQTVSSSDSVTSVGVNASSAVVVSSTGAVALSKPLGQGAVLLVDLRDVKAKSAFEVLLDGRVYDIVQSGSLTAVPVSSYASYMVSVRPIEESELVDYDTSAYKISFFPGNVMQKSWKAERVFILIGRLVDPSGQPIINERIRGAREYAVTDKAGSFQAEVNGIEQLHVKGQSITCNLDIKFANIPEYYLDAGDIRCIPEQLP